MKDVHTEHCCIDHGCKYGEDEHCPVVQMIAEQSHPCEYCAGSDPYDRDEEGKLEFRPGLWYSKTRFGKNLKDGKYLVFVRRSLDLPDEEAGEQVLEFKNDKWKSPRYDKSDLINFFMIIPERPKYKG